MISRSTCALQFAFGLLKLFPTLSPAWDGPESSRILHHDLHTSNIIIGQDGQDKKENETKIVGLLDWEIRQCRSRMGIHVNYRAYSMGVETGTWLRKGGLTRPGIRTMSRMIIVLGRPLPA